MVNYRSIFPVRKCLQRATRERATRDNVPSARAVSVGRPVCTKPVYGYHLSEKCCTELYNKEYHNFVYTGLENVPKELSFTLPEVTYYTCISWTTVTGNVCLWSWLVRVPVQHLVFCVSAWLRTIGCLHGKNSETESMGKISHITSTGQGCSGNVNWLVCIHVIL